MQEETTPVPHIPEEMWEGKPTHHNAGYSTLAGALLFRLGWDTTKAPCPILATCFCRKGGTAKPLTYDPKLRALQRRGHK